MCTFAQAKTRAKKKVMGVLDIYGFEVFEVRKHPENLLLPSHTLTVRESPCYM